jgi:hypothetical protein
VARSNPTLGPGPFLQVFLCYIMKQLKLDVPEVSPLEQLLGSLSSSKNSAAQPSPMHPTPKPAIGKVERSALLGKLQTFLPVLEKANEKLSAEMAVRPASEFDIENVEEGQGPHIEMDLACGIIDLKDKAAEEAAEGAVAYGGRVEEESGSDDDEDSSDDEEDKEQMETEIKKEENKEQNPGGGGRKRKPRIIKEI